MAAEQLQPTPVREFRQMSPERFRAEVLSSQEPAILRGYLRDWPAVRHSSDGNDALRRYLTGFNRGEPVELFLGPPEIEGRFAYTDDLQGFNFARRKDHFHAAMGRLAAMERDTTPPAFYIGASSIARLLPGLERDNPLDLVDPAVVPNIWIGNRNVIPAHYDTSDNVACVVAGRRRFTLFPPEQIRHLYVGPIDMTPAGQPISLVNDLYRPDLDRFPLYAEAMGSARVAELEPGDALFIPMLWWHQVEALSAFNVLINFWWDETIPGSGSPFEALVHGLLTVRQLPPAQRRAWQSFFEHYLFSEQDPAEHIPPDARRALGELTPERAEYLKGFLRNALNN